MNVVLVISYEREEYVARRLWLLPNGGLDVDDGPLAVEPTLLAVREVVPPGMICVPADHEDDPTVVESWINLAS